MKKSNYYIFIIKLIFLFGLNTIQAQDLGRYYKNTNIAVSTNNITSGEIIFENPCLSFKVNSGRVWVKIDLGDVYEKGSATNGKPFDIKINLDLGIKTVSSLGPKINFDIILNNNKPESILYLDLSQYIDVNNTSTGLSYDSNLVNGVEVIINSVNDSLSNINIQNDVNISLHSEVFYGVDVESHQVVSVSNVLDSNSKRVNFSWNSTCEVPNYEFQLLKLFNKDEEFKTDERIIKTNIDWSKALSFQTYKSSETISITIGEGQGYYMWRVRPLGTYYENGSGNDKNWGNWSTTNYTSLDEKHLFDEPGTNLSNEVFFFVDLDDDKNYQYSRVFTEGNKISEKISYATTLNQIKQIQRYLPSKDYKIISQTILDKSGRPTLNTLPVPIINGDKKISKYKTNFVTTNGDLYKSKHFDQNDNYKSPSLIDGTGAFKYYSSMNGDTRISDAEGYPFTRVIFSNDGTDRISEKSGVGKEHMIGSQSNNQGRTVRTLYGTATEDELIKLFGDEAPAAENTAKIITIDPNNTKSVIYITKDGKIIATGLTFSEDQAILDKIETSPSISSKKDKITNNIKTSDGFKSSKRITILKNDTELNLSYTIGELIVEGLCNNLEIERDYKLQIQVFDIETNIIVKDYDFIIESIKHALNKEVTGSDITIDFGTLSLDIGSYYIQKTLIPSESIKAKLVTSQENIRRLIEPYFEWVTGALDEVDCEDEMQYFYNDLFFYGKTIYNESLVSDNGVLQFSEEGGCDNCSGISVKFPKKEEDEDEDLFLDFYSKNKSQYSIEIFYYDEGELKTINYAITNSIDGIKPVAVRFYTPCCEFEVPVVFTPPFSAPLPEALKAYKDNSVANSRLNNSKDYYEINTGEDNIYPNYNFLTDPDNNFTYNKSEDSAGNVTVTLDNTSVYPVDFEGYAISMLYECKKSSNDSYNIEEAKKEIYKAMRGWHKPGLFNQMVHHMLTDSHGENGCKNTEDGTGGVDNSSISSGNTNISVNKYHICDAPRSDVFVKDAQYSIKRLAECWEAIAIELVNDLCISRLQADIDQSSNVASNADEQEPDPSVNEHFNKNITSWIIRWLSRSKLRRKIRNQNAGTSENIKDEVEKKQNLVKKFLDCTGYAYADIISPDEVKNNFSTLNYDFDADIENGEYDPERLVNPNDSNEGKKWESFALHEPYPSDQIPGEDPNKNYYTESYTLTPSDPGYSEEDKEKVEKFLKSYSLNGLFPRIQDPVYAYKYYTYSDEFPGLESQVCYNDPNICEDENGNKVPCCGGTLENPVPCNFCGIGYIKCPYTKESWSCDQRFTFYSMIINFEEAPYEKGIVANCENYYESKKYYINPDYGKYLPEIADSDFSIKMIDDSIAKDAFADFPYISQGLVDIYIESVNGKTGAEIVTELKNLGAVELRNIKGDKNTENITIIENDAYAMFEECNDNCENRRSEFKEDLIKKFKDRCYEIGECKIYPSDNIVPIKDIEALVDKIIEQCKKQCAVTTYACNDEPCRSLKKPKNEFGTSPEDSYDFNTTYIDYGVSGPIVSGISERDSQKLKIMNTSTGNIDNTDVEVTKENISQLSVFEKHSYNHTSKVSIWDMRRSLTYAEYSRWIQAMKWNIDIDIISKCNNSGGYNDTLVENPNQPVYIEDENGNWIEQENLNNCTDKKSTNYISRDNPNGDADTFIDRDKYIINKNTPVTAADTDFTKPIKSRKIGINHKVDPND